MTVELDRALLRDPVHLAERVLGHDHWELPQRVLRQLFVPNARVAIKACHASSKTFLAADAVILALLLGGDVLTTAPTWEQVRSVLWGQIRATLAQAPVDFGSWEVHQTEIRAPTGFALGLSTNEGVRFQGFHARAGSFLLIVFDEAPGVRPDIWTACEGIAAGGDVRFLMLGNPTLGSGPFYELFAGQAVGWHRYTISAFDTPNLRGLTLDQLLALPEHELDQNERPYLCTRRFVRDKFYEWGRGHPDWEARILAEFPSLQANALIPLAALELATASAGWSPSGGPVVAGLDVAGPGEDETCLWLRQGGRLLECRAWKDPDPRQAVVEALKAWLPRGLRTVNVDSVGQGYYFALQLREALAGHGVTVNAVNVGQPSLQTDELGRRRFANLKAELYWRLRDRFLEGAIQGLRDDVTRSQLGSLLYEHDQKGQVVIESKEQARRRGVKSPDRAEALMLSFYEPERRLLWARAMQAAPSAEWPLSPGLARRRAAARRARAIR